MESKKINQLATELAPDLSDLTIIGDPTTGISKKITLSQMASLFTGTVEEYANLAAFPLVGVADTIYIALDTNILYRWNTGTSAYVELSPNIVSSLVFNDANGFDGTINLVGSVATLTITTALTTGSVGFIGASGALLQDNANFFWDDTNNRLGINTNAPTTALDVFGSGIIGRINGTSTNNAYLGFASAGTNKWSIGNVQSDHRFRIYNEATTSELVSVLSTGEFGIGIANPTTKFHIDGGASALIANLDANVSVAKSVSFRSDNSNRFNIEVSGTESGSNAGADFFIRRYSDAGSLIDTPLTIIRSTGNATFLANVTAAGLIGTGLYTNSWYAGSGSTLSLRTAASAVIADFSPTTSYILGKVGINGSTTPAAALTVYDTTSGSEQLRLGNSTGSGYWGIGRENNITGNLYFNSGGTVNVVFATTGSVGIGSTTIYNGGGFGRVLSFYAPSSLALTYVTDTQQYQVGIASSDYRVYDVTGSTYRFVVKGSTGNVVIGDTTSNGSKFQVNGDISSTTSVQNSSIYIISSSVVTNISTLAGGIIVIRDQSNGGTCVAMYENGAAPVIIAQSGPTVYTTSSPSASQIQLANKSPFGGVTALGGSSRNGVQLSVATFKNS